MQGQVPSAGMPHLRQIINEQIKKAWITKNDQPTLSEAGKRAQEGLKRVLSEKNVL